LPRDGREGAAVTMAGKPPISDRRQPEITLLVGAAVSIFVAFGMMARVPLMEIQMGWLGALTLAMLLILLASGLALWRVTKFT